MEGIEDRKTKPQCGLILENREGKILLQLRDAKPWIPYPDRYGTFGGQIEEGETALQAITREIKEELDYNLVDPEYMGNYPFHGYDIHMFRKADPSIVIEDLVVREGQRGEFLSLEGIREVDCAFNCREIAEDYFQRYKS